MKGIFFIESWLSMHEQKSVIVHGKSVACFYKNKGDVQTRRSFALCTEEKVLIWVYSLYWSKGHVLDH